jgi:hypothetical protein
VLAGCGGSSKDASDDAQRPALGKSADEAEAARGLGFPAFATKNTTRIGGADPVANAAAAALAVYPSRSRDTRPRAVVLVDKADWRSAVSAAQLMSRPIRAPILFTDADKLPPATEEALRTLAPTGAPQAGDAQVIRVGGAASPEGWRVTDVEGTDHTELARAIDKVRSTAAGRANTGRSVVIASADAPEYAMPAANWAAKSGDPVFWVSADGVPAATRDALAARARPRMYVLGPASVISDAVMKELESLGEVRRVAGADPVQSAIAFARFSDGRFGWNAVDPGHGIVIASAQRPLDAPASAPLSAAGSYGPLLLVAEAAALPGPLQGYLLDIQPGYEVDPVRAVYNHGWLMGDEAAISVDVQARIDALLEVQPVQQAPEG